MASPYLYYMESKYEYKWGILFDIVLARNPRWVKVDRVPPDSYVHLSDKNTVSLFQNYLDGDKYITLKHNLAELLHDTDITPETIVIKNAKLTISHNKAQGDKGGIWFMKPSDRFVGEGKDIILYNTFKDIDLGDPRIKKYKYWVLQREVHPPMLIEAKKFVIRFFSLYVYRPRKIYLLIHNKCRVNLYAKTYSEGTDPTAQISHNTLNLTMGTSSKVGMESGLYNVDGTLFGYESIMQNAWPQIRSIVSTVSDKLIDKLDTSMCVGYSVYGYDFTLRDDGKVYLIEVNERPYLNFLPDTLRDAITLPLIAELVKCIECMLDRETYTPVFFEAMRTYTVNPISITCPTRSKKLMAL